MKKRRLSPTWTILEDKSVINNLGDHVGYAHLDENGEYYLTKSEPKTFNELLEAIKRQ